MGLCSQRALVLLTSHLVSPGMNSEKDFPLCARKGLIVRPQYPSPPSGAYPGLGIIRFSMKLFERSFFGVPQRFPYQSF